MPGRDRTGPLGQGAMTGRGFGVCSGMNTGLNSAGVGSGLGRGMRGGCFRRWCGPVGYPANVAAPAQKEVLNQQKAMLENQLEMIRKQLAGLSEDDK